MFKNKVQLKVWVNKNTRAKVRRIAKANHQTMSVFVEDLLIKFKEPQKKVRVR